MPVKLFFCYAHEDEPLLNKLKSHLSPLRRQGLIQMWHDRDISAGTEWEQEIKEQLNTAQIILLLISPDFMNSDYCYGIEMQRAIERHKRGEARVIPVILRPVYWQGEPLGALQALPSDAKPVTDPDWHNLDRALFNVTEGIRKAIDNVASRPLTSPSVSPVIPQPEQAVHSPQNYLGTQAPLKNDQYLPKQQQLLSQNKGSFSHPKRPIKLGWLENQYFIGVVAGLLSLLLFFLSFYLVNPNSFWFWLQGGGSPPASLLFAIFDFLAWPIIICFIAGYIIGKNTLKARAGFRVGFISAIIYFSVFIILLFINFALDFTGNNGTSFSRFTLIILQIPLVLLIIICRRLGLLGSELANRKRPII